jgi:general L-amino acid transport system permease protein
MSENAQPPPPENQYYVTRADLSKSRPAPEESSMFEILASSRWTRIAGLLGYLTFIGVAWVAMANTTLVNWMAGVIFGIIASLPFFGVVMTRALNAQRRTKTPFFRDVVFLADFTQVIFLFLVAFAGFLLMANLFQNLSESDLRINFRVLERTFGTEVTEGPDPNADLVFLTRIPIVGQTLYDLTFLQPDSNTRALMVGLINTLRVVSISLVFATISGVLLGIALLSNNWLVRKAASAFVEIFRNTPLLLQLYFIYRGLLRILPTLPVDAWTFPGNIYLSGRGLYYPSLQPTDTTMYLMISVLIGVGAGLFLWRQRVRQMESTGQLARVFRYFSLSVLSGVVIGFGLAFALGGAPFSFDIPEPTRFRFSGGASFSPEFIALALGLIFYTSAFIADIVRAGIQSVPKGQVEAAYASGLNNSQTLQLIVLPQAMRLILPPLTNQYLNLTKNSSLAIAIGFYDVYNVANVIQNQTGQAVALFISLMIVYLFLSLIISLVMNVFNQSRQYKTR